MTITIVTPWLGHPELAGDYMQAVIGEGAQVTIIDNGDAPADMPFFYAKPTRNLGFARGSNLGLMLSHDDAVLFLNNDIQLVRRGWLDEIRDALEPGVLVGQMRDGPHAARPYLDGWCLAGMREDLLALGGFDVGLSEPAYYSDNLLCLEAQLAGMELRHVNVGLRHLENRTAGNQWDASVRAASSDNRARYQARVREALAAV